MKRDLRTLGHPLFLISLSLLILNDWVLKTAWSHPITGKLSDFAGLFAFPFFFSALFPAYRKGVHLASVLLFVWWKSPLADSFIATFQAWSIPMHRTPDYTDLIALLSVGFSYYLFRSEWRVVLPKLALGILLAVSSFSFLATSVAPHYRYMAMVPMLQIYHFNFSKRELIYRLNMVQLKRVQRLEYGHLDFNQEKNGFYYPDTSQTMVVLIDYESVKDQDSVKYESAASKFLIVGDSLHSQIVLQEIKLDVVPLHQGKAEEWSVTQFEKQIIRKIEKY
ncbi:hypothetical protein KFE98_13360 [bacterium SCSIO 12741]|nr:hypothetical protein KFE98_13360 [bacterium SCSIO 12741]